MDVRGRVVIKACETFGEPSFEWSGGTETFGHFCVFVSLRLKVITLEHLLVAKRINES